MSSFFGLLFCIWSVYTTCIPLLFSRVAVLFSTGCSRAGIPPISLRGLLKEYCIHFHIHIFNPSYNFLRQRSLCRLLCCVVGCSIGGARNPLSQLFSRRRKVSFSREISLESSWEYFIYLALGHIFPIIYNAVPARDCVILEGSFSEGSCGSFGVFSCDWRVQPFMGGYLLLVWIFCRSI